MKTEFSSEQIVWNDVDAEMPDSDVTVLVFCPPSDDPVWLGFHDGETWRTPDNDDLGKEFVTHWAHLPAGPLKPSPLRGTPS